MTTGERRATVLSKADIDYLLAAIDDAEAKKRSEAAPPRKTLMGMIQNGIGLTLSRVVIIVVLPAFASLALYAFNTTMGRMFDRMDHQDQAIVDLKSDLKAVADKLVDAQISIGRLQGDDKHDVQR